MAKTMKKDFMKKYNRQRIASNIWVVVTSLVLALWINFYLLDQTEIWQNLTASILNVNQNETRANLYLENNSSKILLKSSATLQQPVSLSVTLVYNPENLEINGVTTNFWDASFLWEMGTWFDTVLLIMNGTRDIYAGDTVLEIFYSKKVEGSVGLNMLNANFVDANEEQYSLTTQWVTF